LALDNGITLCPSHHTFNHEFSAHKAPEAFKWWFEENYPDRAKRMKTKERIHMTELQAIKEFTAAQINITSHGGFPITTLQSLLGA
jgi:hypothetical protein